MQNEPSQTPRLDAWSRYFARMLDVLVFSLLVGIVAAVAGTLAAPEATDEVIAVMDSSRLWTMVADLASFVIALPLIAMSLVLGQTPGKWLFGIRVRGPQGDKLRLSSALHRELLVWTRGLALGLPLLSFVTLVMSYARLTEDGATAWDRRVGSQVSHVERTPVWWLKAVSAATFVVALILWNAFAGLFVAA